MGEEKPTAKGLSAEDIRHPSDQASFTTLVRRIEENAAAQKFIDRMMVEVEQEALLINMADNTRLGEGQYPDIHQLLCRAAGVLGMTTPELFLDTSSEVSAGAVGRQNPLIYLTTEALELMTEEELLTIFGHELGHILCDHTFFRLLAQHYNGFAFLAGMIPIVGSAIALALRLPLFEWYRCSELSADRTALLAVQDPEVVIRMISKLAGGRKSQSLSMKALMDQADEFESLRAKAKREGGLGERVGSLLSEFAFLTATSTHPWPGVRIREIRSWAESEEYRDLLNGNYEAVRQRKSAAAAAAKPEAKPSVTGNVVKDSLGSLKNLFKKK